MPFTIYLQWVAPPLGASALARRLWYVVLILTAAYFGVLECRWGRTVGKALCGLTSVPTA